MTASSPVLDIESKWAFDSPSGCGASAVGLMTKSSGDDPRAVALYTIVRPSGMNRALVIGSRSNVRASKVTTPVGVGAGWRHAIAPMARPPATPAATASGSHQRRRAVGRRWAPLFRVRTMKATSPRARTRCRWRTETAARDSSRDRGARRDRARAESRRRASAGGSCLRIALMRSTEESPPKA